MPTLSHSSLLRSHTLKVARTSYPRLARSGVGQLRTVKTACCSYTKSAVSNAQRHFTTAPPLSVSAAAAVKRLHSSDPPEPPLTPATSPDLPVSRVDDREVVVGFDTASWTRFHHVWLRDHCRCPECFHPITKQRLFSTFDIPPDLKPVRAESKADGLEVFWPSSVPHTSFYPWTWLREHSYDPPLRQHEISTEKILWGSRIRQTPPTVSYDEVIAQDDHGLFKWLSNIDKFGLCFVSGVPPTAEATEELATRIATHLEVLKDGKFWDFTSDFAKGDTAYTTVALGAHTDNTYFTDPCGLQLFHLLSHTEGTGGQTLLVDGFYVASILKELHPEVYATLTRAHPTLEHRGDLGTGQLVRVTWNNDDRSVMDHLSSTEMEEWYNAIRLWHKFLTSADSEYWVQLSPGTAVVVDNHRVLHGRSAFNGKRRMCGAYIGKDEFRSKFEVLSERFAPDAVTQATQKDIVNGRSLWSPYV
ncbi:hypothetical protein NM688_g3937 [Phlebia brevispora]|uniref:Uncharacterized protein n=1 Tax=Phlebia brevispora TaxID=194682 RepID=A0ACC1T4B8_9APHY|nr:hypothetical protein NM688_g3937 [Phlebia brevispora]